MTHRYVAAARELYLYDHIADGDTTRCGKNLTDQTMLWQDIPAHAVTNVCPGCDGTATQGTLL